MTPEERKEIELLFKKSFIVFKVLALICFIVFIVSLLLN
jgi:hypothetical protein